MSSSSSSSSSSFYETYDISETFGFLTDTRTICPNLPAEFDIFKDIIQHINEPDGHKFRQLVDALSTLGHPPSFYIDLVTYQPERIQKILYSVFTFIVQKYIRCLGKEGQVDYISYEIGLIWYHTAKTFDLPTVTSYSALVLWNWRLRDPTKTPSLTNFDVIHAITGLPDEEWFYKIHMQIEYLGAKLLKDMHDIHETTRTIDNTIAFMHRFSATMEMIRQTIGQMREGCTPDNYWNHVRIFLGGYTKENGLPDGLHIKGTNIKNIKFGGGSAAQSTLIQAFDEFIGIEHPAEHALSFLRQQRAYMPEKHVRYLERLGSNPTLKAIVNKYDNPKLTEEFNAVVKTFTKFRATHYALVHEYVIKFLQEAKIAETLGDEEQARQIKKNNLYGGKGTGGTTLTVLDEYRRDTFATQIKKEGERASENGSDVNDDSIAKKKPFISFEQGVMTVILIVVVCVYFGMYNPFGKAVGI